MRSLSQCCSSFRSTRLCCPASWLRAALCVPLCLFSLFGFAAAPAPADEYLEASALTLIEKRCLACHDPGTKSSGLDLSTLDGARRGGTKGPALVAGAPHESLLYRRVAAGEMPLGNPLPEEERELLRRWIEAGSLWSRTLASGPPAEDKRPRGNANWWSLQPLQRTPAPDTPAAPAAWQRSPIDRRIYATLASEALEPSPPATRRALIRRAGFDLLGLPPTPAEVEAFVNDPSDNAYERLIDRLLASPRYGERWARHWLDVARFSESEGFERDWMRVNAWPYRDYVIRSFNADKSYRLFAEEQIAGDVMDPPTRDGVVATGFLVSGPYDAVGLTSAVKDQRKQVRENQLEEMLSVVGQTFLGLTVNCARCHDHKFDPIPQRDYYRVKAAFEGVWLGERDLLTRPEAAARREKTTALKNAYARVEDQIHELLEPVREPALRARGSEPAAGLPKPLGLWRFDRNSRDQAGSMHIELTDAFELSDGVLRRVHERVVNDVFPGIATAKLPHDVREKTLEAWVAVDELPEESSVIVNIRSREDFRGAALDGIRYTGKKDGHHWENTSTANFRTLDVKGPSEDTAPGGRVHLAVVYRPDHTIAIYRNGLPYGEAYRPEPADDRDLLQTYIAGDAEVSFNNAIGLAVDEARLYDRALSPEQIAASFQAGAPGILDKELRGLMTAQQRSRFDALDAESVRLTTALAEMGEPNKIYAAEIREPEPTHVLARGHIGRPGELVSAGGLSNVAGLSAELGLAPDAPEGERRKRFAGWLTSEDNPLFARAIVNRVWHYHFGRGFTANPNDLGFNGGRPSHPELLDALAFDFVADGWSLKKLHKRIMLLAAYRQSAAFNEQAAARDADNELLWRYPPRRLEGEAVRDAMLAVSGKLNRKMGGPSFRPFESERIGSLEHYKLLDKDDPELDRRTVYRMNINSGTDPLLDALDCPIPAVKTPQRLATTTPLQALSLMNNAFVLRQAKFFAERVAEQAGEDPDARIDTAFQLALGRPPDEPEVAWSRSLLGEHGLESLCWGLFNTGEFLYVN